MDSIDNDLYTDSIKTVLPKITDVEIAAILAKVENIGLDDFADRHFVKAGDLDSILKQGHVRKLLDSWTKVKGKK